VSSSRRMMQRQAAVRLPKGDQAHNDKFCALCGIGGGGRENLQFVRCVSPQSTQYRRRRRGGERRSERREAR
jgi:hypothetical protein